MIDEKINRYKNGILAAKELSKRKYADHAYYENKISKFEKAFCRSGTHRQAELAWVD